MKKYLLWLVILAVLVGLVIVTWPKVSKAPIPIQSEYDDKVVYGIGDEVDRDAARKDCDARGGTFNTCGSSCKTGEICIKVCAFTCEFKK